MPRALPDVASLISTPRTDAELAKPMTDAELHSLFDLRPGHTQDWEFFMLQNGLNEYYTPEYITAFAGYLGQRATEVSAQYGKPPTIVEIAAGRGVLSLLLNNAFREAGQDTVVQASDNGSWPQGKNPLPHVMKEDFRGTFLDLYHEKKTEGTPHIIIGAWLPGIVDKEVRDIGYDCRRSGAAEYILIGCIEGETHCTYTTWGRDMLGRQLTPAPYEEEGYQRETLAMPPQYYHSMTTETPPSLTVSFRHNPASA